MGNIGNLRQVSTYIDKDVYKVFMEKIEKEDRSASYIIKKLILEYLDKNAI